MSNEKDIKKDRVSSEGKDKPMERRSFLKKIGLAGGAALAHFFMLGKPSTAFGGQDSDIIDGGLAKIKSRCRPGASIDKYDACFINEEAKEVGDQCYIRQWQELKEVGDECRLVLVAWTDVKEVGDKCTPIQPIRSPTAVEVGDKCEMFGSGLQLQVRGDRCFVSPQTSQEVYLSDICATTGGLDFGVEFLRETDDECHLMVKADAPSEEVGDNCSYIPDATPAPEAGDQCFIGIGTGQEIGDKCYAPGDPSTDTIVDQ